MLPRREQSKHIQLMGMAQVHHVATAHNGGCWFSAVAFYVCREWLLRRAGGEVRTPAQLDKAGKPLRSWVVAQLPRWWARWASLTFERQAEIQLG